MAPRLGEPPELGVQRRQVEVSAGARRIEAAGALEMRKGSVGITLQEDRQPELLVRLGPIGRVRHRDVQPSDRLGRRRRASSASVPKSSATSAAAAPVRDRVRHALTVA